MKKYTVEITEDKTGTHIKRANEGFTLFEIIGFVSVIKDDLVSIFNKGMKLEETELKSTKKKVIKKSKVVKTLK